MKIAVVGAGGIGGYFGALLAAAGEDVHFIVRSHSVPVLREQGITIESAVTPLRLAQRCKALYDTKSYIF